MEGEEGVDTNPENSIPNPPNEVNKNIICGLRSIRMLLILGCTALHKHANLRKHWKKNVKVKMALHIYVLYICIYIYFSFTGPL